MVLPDIERRLIQLEKRNKVLEEMVHEYTKELDVLRSLFNDFSDFRSVTAFTVVQIMDFLGDDFAKYFDDHLKNTIKF